VSQQIVTHPHEIDVQLPIPRACVWHLVTSEYPPQHGGVSDYTSRLAATMARQGEEVHVWCPGTSGLEITQDGVHVHRDFGKFRPVDLRHVAQALDRFSGPRRLVVQWVPHGYGYRSMNLAFCWWLERRSARHQDHITLVVHEPFLTFRWLSMRQSAAALVHRLMILLTLRAAKRVLVTIPEWERRLRPYAFRRDVQFGWQPIFSNIPVLRDPSRTPAIRAQFAAGGQLLIGHFGTFGSLITPLLRPILQSLTDEGQCHILLMGEHSDEFREQLISEQPQIAGVLHATGRLSADELSSHLAACDLMIQPYPDGVSSRRGSFMAGFCNGLPTVTTTGWLTESFWADSGAVALAPAGDAAAFLTEVQRLGSSAAQRERMSRAARSLYDERFDISRTVAALRIGAEEDRACES
jgi:glycosyltransferase involved in cell wall biosynthesis